MNNHRLLTGLLLAGLLSGVLYSSAQNTPKVATLEELFEIAETNSTQLRPMFSTEQEAGKEIEVARRGRLPEINANLKLSFIGDGFTTRRNLTDYQKAPIPHFGSGLGIEITQPVYTGGALTAGIELAELKSTATKYATELKRNDIRFQLTGFYLDIYKCANLRKVIEKQIEQAEKVLCEMKARYEQGTALHNDITRYELLIANLNLQLIKINNTIDILNNNLVVTAGLPEGSVILPDTTILARSLPNLTESVWQQEAKENSPSLKLARSGIDISRKAEAIVRSNRLPKIGLQAGWTMDGPILVEVPPINRNLSYWYVGVGVSYNLSSLYKTDKSLTKSRIATRHAEEEYEAACECISLGVRADYIRYLEAYEELKTRIKSVELAEINYTTVSTRYLAGMALITDLLDAADSEISAQQELVNARINIIYYYYKLLFTTGKI